MIGVSYGGYMTSWVVGHTDRFKAACSEAAMFVALKKLGRDVVFVRMPDAGHGFGVLGRPRQRLERLRIVLDWFARYLRPESPAPLERP